MGSGRLIIIRVISLEKISSAIFFAISNFAELERLRIIAHLRIELDAAASATTTLPLLVFEPKRVVESVTSLLSSAGVSGVVGSVELRI